MESSAKRGMAGKCSSVCLARNKESPSSLLPPPFLLGGIWHSIRLLTVYEPITEGGKDGRASVWTPLIRCLNHHQ